MLQCDNCHKELDRQVYCDDKCRMQYVRKANKTSPTVRKANKTSPTVRKANTSEEVAEVLRPLAAVTDRPPLSYRDSKGQCQHKLKRYCAYGCYKKR